MKEFWSIDECRISALVIILVLITAAIIYGYCSTGKVDGNIKDIADTLILCIAGVNGINIFKRGDDK